DGRALQTLLVQSPSLLPSPGPGELAVAANFRIGSTASVDLLGVGVDGRIVLVECGRQEGPGRRPMGGAALAVGAGLWRAPYEEFDRAFAVRAGVPLLDKAAAIARAGGRGWDAAAFRGRRTRDPPARPVPAARPGRRPLGTGLRAGAGRYGFGISAIGSGAQVLGGSGRPIGRYPRPVRRHRRPDRRPGARRGPGCRVGVPFCTPGGPGSGGPRHLL